MKNVITQTIKKNNAALLLKKDVGGGGRVVGALFIGQIALSFKQGFQIITVRLDYLPLFGI